MNDTPIRVKTGFNNVIEAAIAMLKVSIERKCNKVSQLN